MSNAHSPETGGKPPVALIAGPTASGKTDLSVRLAAALSANGRPAAVINADSAQVYADLQILSARPSTQEMRGLPHLLFGAWDGATPCSAADWAAAAKAEIARLHGEGAVSVLVGGTGLYLRTLLEGIAPVPPIDTEVRAAVRALSRKDARDALEREDPAAAARIAPADSARTCRALEVIRATGSPLAEWQKEKSGGIAADIALHPMVLLPPREWLYARCDARFEAMMAGGAEREVATLLARGLDPTLPVMRAIGVPELSCYLRGTMSREECIAAGQLATRQYAKRQYTWFRHQPPDGWPRIETFNDDTVTNLVSLLLD